MHRERLEMMRDLLREDAANPEGAQFDLGLWAGHSEVRRVRGASAAIAYDPDELGVNAETTYQPINERQVDGDKLPKLECGTIGCALGIAALSRRFERFGLTMTWLKVTNHEIQLVPICNGADGFAAGAELFDISGYDSRYFFDPDCYAKIPTEAEGELFVAQRIDDFLNGVVNERWHPGGGDDEDETFDGMGNRLDGTGDMDNED